MENAFTLYTKFNSIQITYTYEGLRTWGRIVPDLTTIPNKSRDYYCKKIDINSCFLVILYNLCIQYEIKCPYFYKFYELRMQGKIDSLILKSFYNFILFSETLPLWYEHSSRTVAFNDDLIDDINHIIDILIPKYKLEYYYAIKEYNDGHIKNYWFWFNNNINIKKLFLYILLSRIESEIINIIFKYLLQNNIDIYLIFYDGILYNTKNEINLNKLHQYLHQYYPKNITFKDIYYYPWQFNEYTHKKIGINEFRFLELQQNLKNSMRKSKKIKKQKCKVLEHLLDYYYHPDSPFIQKLFKLKN